MNIKVNLMIFIILFLFGRLFEIDPVSADDYEIESFITDYDSDESYDNNCCTWLKIGEIGSSEYNGKTFKFINLLPKDGKPISVNLSLFKYGMSLVPVGNNNFFGYDSNKAVYRCTVDNSIIDPVSFFSNHIGKKILYVFSFEAINKFNSHKRCIYFAFKDVSVSDLRKHIRYSQIAVLKKCLLRPDGETPFPYVKIGIDGETNIRPRYEHLESDFTYKYTLNYFDNEFRSKFQNRLTKLEKKAKKYFV